MIWICRRISRRFQSTHPLRGATSQHPANQRPERDFNPRTPCGVRPCAATTLYTCIIYFNPRTPCGVRHVGLQQQPGHVAFQSTHPLRGATRVPVDRHAVRLISIHAPLAGCDALVTVLSAMTGTFQSTHPLRGATAGKKALVRQALISIHAPLAGCDYTARQVALQLLISIHAPLAGCDGGMAGGGATWPHFNPRTPCGVRLAPAAQLHGLIGFQSTHPLRGATTPYGHSAYTSRNFNPRTPCGVRRPPCRSSRRPAHFNPRTPCGVRRDGQPFTVGRIEFQSTHPLRGATWARSI